ncbi:hypothetical protein P280DRAFT_490010 [Massarina eburnea CBS 473.64]|uniref:Uncharacterized protein n=1 Tax=Massarina eburnea CBS 473.64 TaxID=1395130 RepID=A0A6A6S1G8_9PLEO|nr:hypothetical protein P280DRAFT_490010 [Massarina eburnea CBS 473.64]
MSAAEIADSPDAVDAALEAYNWDDDVEFQAGLSAILGSTSSPEQTSELTLRARCFYYARKFNINVDFDAYKAYRSSHDLPALIPPPVANSAQPPDAHITPTHEGAGSILPASGANPNEPPAPYPTSFAQIVELVTTGQPIPGIKEVPPTVLTGQGSQAAQSKRKKPWEKDAPAVEGN